VQSSVLILLLSCSLTLVLHLFCSFPEKCKLCNPGHFLDDAGVCIPPFDCVMDGKIPLGAYGGKCVSAGYECTVGLDADCVIPTSLGDSCSAFRVASTGQLQCTQCDTTANWSIEGACVSKRVCYRRQYQDTGGSCSCNLGASVEYCGTCTLYKSPAQMPTIMVTMPTYLGLYRECTSCRKRRVLEAGQCILAALATCSASEVLYSPGPQGSACETPFACGAGVRATGPKIDQTCSCLDKDLCRDCFWGLTGHQCTTCKKFTVLHAGKCITQEACVIEGGLPLLTDGPRGGVCKTA
jgi:hypothetical protein